MASGLVCVKGLAFFNFLVDFFFVVAMFFPFPSDCPHGRSRVDNRQIRGQCTVTRGRKPSPLKCGLCNGLIPPTRAAEGELR
jgi:hypothetical protein